MRRIDMSAVIKRFITMLGKSCRVALSNGDEVLVVALLEPVWRKSKTQFEAAVTEIGEGVSDYYSYTGPADFDITRLCRDDVLYFKGMKYYFIEAEQVIVGDTVQYCAGILKRIFEEDEYVY